MFTGLVEGVCRVEWVRPRGRGRELSLRLGALAEGVRPGDSVALSGACATVERLSGPAAVFYLGEETLARTWFDRGLHTGTRLNVERALPATGRLEGHLVQGHVDATARVRGWDRSAAEGPFTVELPPAWARYVVLKGSIALDGVSLTVAGVEGTTVTAALIPHTAAGTTLAERRPGDRVNLETDILARYVERLLPPHGVGPA
jgi:riboflavin synthase